MTFKSALRTTTMRFSSLLCLAFTSSSAMAQDNLPQPDPTFHGKVGETYHDARADPAMQESASFNLDAVKKKIDAAAAGHGQ